MINSVLRILQLYRQHIPSEEPSFDLLPVVYDIASQWELHRQYDDETAQHFERFVLSQLKAKVVKEEGLLLFENTLRFHDGSWIVFIRMTIPSQAHYMHSGFFYVEDLVNRNVVIHQFPELQANLLECGQLLQAYMEENKQWLDGIRIEYVLPRLTV